MCCMLRTQDEPLRSNFSACGEPNTCCGSELHMAINRTLRFFLIENIPTNFTSSDDATDSPMIFMWRSYLSSIDRMKVYSGFSSVLMKNRSSRVLSSCEPEAPGLPIASAPGRIRCGRRSPSISWARADVA